MACVGVGGEGGLERGRGGGGGGDGAEVEDEVVGFRRGE